MSRCSIVIDDDDDDDDDDIDNAMSETFLLCSFKIYLYRFSDFSKSVTDRRTDLPTEMRKAHLMKSLFQHRRMYSFETLTSKVAWDDQIDPTDR